MRADNSLIPAFDSPCGLRLSTSFLDDQVSLDVAQAEDRAQDVEVGQADEAGELLLKCLAVSSPSTSLVETFVPRFEAAGQAEWADRLFEAAAGRFTEVLARFPDSAMHHNNLAWACVRCQRWPERRLHHARRAVELNPDHPLVEVPWDHGVYRCFFEFSGGPPKIHEHDDRPAQGFGICAARSASTSR